MGIKRITFLETGMFVCVFQREIVRGEAQAATAGAKAAP